MPSLLLLAVAVALAGPPARVVPTVRSIQVELISTVETKLDPAAIERATMPRSSSG